ncbi:MAG: LamG domain-containing protein [Sedimentisphaerales bacterium]|nr:LamG domain-containing protein [Sedimentisphaerales bacterium]
MYKALICCFLLLVLILSSNTSAELIAHWKFDENSGSTAQDASGKGKTGTLKGNPQWVTGKIGGAILLDGDGDYVEIGRVGISGAAQRTMTGWAKASTTDIPAWTSVFGFAPDGDTDATYFDIEADGTGNYVVHVGGWESILTPLDTQWHHFALTYNGRGGSWYLDGQLVSSLDGELGTIDQVRIGARLSNSNYFPGLIDDVRIYNTVLTQNEIKKLMAGDKAFDPTPANGTLYMDIWISLGWLPGNSAVSHDVYFGDNFTDVNEGNNETFQANQTEEFFVVGLPETPFPEGLVPGTTYYWRIDEVEADGTTINKGDIWSFSIPSKKAYNPNPVNGAESVATDVVLSWTKGFKSKIHTIYFGDNFDDVNDASGGLPLGPASYDPGTLKTGKTYYWRVDEFDAVTTHKGDIWTFTTEGAVRHANPSNGAVNVTQTVVLNWTPSDYAASHQVYFGTDNVALRNADTGSSEYKGDRNLGSESYDPGKLEWNTSYYWRIDEVNNAHPDSPWIGPVWSFTTANFLIVDDFESYNDLEPDEPGSNRIFNAWIDGFNNPTNGSLVGFDTPPFAEQTIVHSGKQSMPFVYDNAAGKSEATLTLTYPRDWTEKSVDTLTIWFKGKASNAAETLYVALNNSALVNHDNPNAAKINQWTQWNIDLQSFVDQGVNLTNVNSITIGLGNRNNPHAGGSGLMHFDDIRLHLPQPQPEPMP